jgi:hypothetical protein
MTIFDLQGLPLLDNDELRTFDSSQGADVGFGSGLSLVVC